MTADRARTSRTPVNPASGSSGYYQVYPDASGSPDLIDDGPDRGRQMMPRRLVVMGAITEGETRVLVVQRADGVEVAIPVPYVAVGKPLGGDESISAKKLLPQTITAVRHTGSGPEGVSFTGTPAAQGYEFVVEITTSGALNAGAYRWSSDGGQNWNGPSTLPADGTDALGATGITVNFPAGAYVDNDLYEAESFLTTVTNILVCW